MKIVIIGSGVSGLIAARVLEQNGYHPIVIEATQSVGGRVKTDTIGGYHLDHGFQVLLTEYPLAKKYLDYDALDLQYFVPGSLLLGDSSSSIIGDPLRDSSLLFPTLFNTKATISDKLKIFKLNKYLQGKSISAIFKGKSKTTLAYLTDLGFSNKVIHHFFKPFFTGIFLEDALETSHKMFEFIMKMFGTGKAAIPKKGIGVIAEQLKANLKHTIFKFNSKVASFSDNKILLENSEEISFDYLVNATNNPNLNKTDLFSDKQWHESTTIYFETDTRITDKKIIGLVSNSDMLVNNLYYPSNFDNNTDKHLLSVTIVKAHQFNTNELIQKITAELKSIGITGSLKYINHYQIKRSLPKLTEVAYYPINNEVSSSIFNCGDSLANGSLNAAMLSGEQVALNIIEKIKSKN